MRCPWCNRKKVTHFSAVGSAAEGFTVARKYTSCADCKPKLTSECPNPARARILCLDLSIVNEQFENVIDRKQMTEFIKNVLGQ
jgi:hypothetical protein